MCDIFIPYGLYCYEVLSIEPSKKHGFIIKIKPCDHYKRTGDKLIGFCKLLECDVWDSVKECDLNDFIFDDDTDDIK